MRFKAICILKNRIKLQMAIILMKRAFLLKKIGKMYLKSGKYADLAVIAL